MENDSVLHIQSYLTPNLGGIGGRRYFLGLAGFLLERQKMFYVQSEIQESLLVCANGIIHSHWRWPVLRCGIVQVLAPLVGFKPVYQEQHGNCPELERGCT